jgi:hypothetical protein
MLCSCGKLLLDVEKMPFQLLLLFFPPQKLCVGLFVLRCIIIVTCLQADEILECVKDIHAVTLYCRKELFEYCGD